MTPETSPWRGALAALLGLVALPAAAAETGAAETGAPSETDAPAETGAPAETDETAPDGDPLAPHRLPFAVLTERAIGTASRAVEVDWRRHVVQVGAAGTQLAELNNFHSLKAAAVVRLPVDNLILELGLGHVWVWDTASTRALALTPFRQPGRPRRVELDLSLGWPLAEGVVTTAPRWMPALELVFMGTVGLRYLGYPGSMAGMRFGERLSAALSPGLTETELATLDRRRLEAMQFDPTRYTPMVGVGNDIYLAQGVFVSPRANIAVPLLAGAIGSEMGWWGEFALVAGVAF